VISASNFWADDFGQFCYSPLEARYTKREESSDLLIFLFEILLDMKIENFRKYLPPQLGSCAEK
jgi:hypothetical protein